MVFLVGSGYTLTTALSTISSLVQEHTPDELRGRVMSIFGLAFRGGLPIGSLIAGVLVRRAGVPAVMAVSSALLLVVAVWLLLRHRDLRAL
jgi:predicted MFS family arabinose efflux permease